MNDPSPSAPPRPAGLARLAAAVLVAGQVPWVVLTVTYFRYENGTFSLWNVSVALLTLALAAGVALLMPRPREMALVLSYYAVAVSSYWAYVHRLWPLWISAAAGLGAAVLLNRLREAVSPPPPRKPADATPETLAVWIKENLEAIVIAFVMALVIRCFCIEVFKIPSSSMEPTLLGDQHAACPFDEFHVSDGGDRIMVTKFYYALSPIERFDVVVFKFPLDQSRNFIKRVVGLPGEDLMIHGGNLFVRPAGGTGEFTIARKPLRVQQSLWIDLLRERDANDPKKLSDRQIFMNHWEAGAPDGEAGKHAEYRVGPGGGEVDTLESEGKRGIRFRFKPEIKDTEGSSVGDVRVAFDFELTGPKGEVFAEISNECGRFEARLSTDGPGLLHSRFPQGEDRKEIVDFRLSMDRRYRFELAVFDGKAQVFVDGDLLKEHAFLESLSAESRVRDYHKTGVAFGTRGVTFKVKKLAMGRDICYRGKKNIHEDVHISIPAEKYVMMGDNVTSSHDSRAWLEYTYKLKDGTEIRCESQETSENSNDALIAVRDQLGLDWTPEVAIKADVNGTPWPLRKDQIAEGYPVTDAFPFVHRKYIVGKGFWIWWPAGRWFRLIR